MILSLANVKNDLHITACGTGIGGISMRCVICTKSVQVAIYCLSCLRTRGKHPDDCPKPYMHQCCIDCMRMLSKNRLFGESVAIGGKITANRVHTIGVAMT